MFRRIVVEFLADDRGSVVATEYLTLGTVLALGSVTGLTSIRDSVNEECAEFSTAVREVRREHTPAAARGARVRPASATTTYAPTGDEGAGYTFHAPQIVTP